MGYNLAYKCACGAYRWADSAHARGERHYMKCGRAFKGTPETMFFYRKGPPSTPGGRGAAASAEAQSGEARQARGRAKAKAKPKAAAKAGASPRRPWRPRPRSSSTRQSSGDGDTLHIQAKRRNDAAYQWEMYAAMARSFGHDDFLRHAEVQREAALKNKADSLPPPAGGASSETTP